MGEGAGGEQQWREPGRGTPGLQSLMSQSQEKGECTEGGVVAVPSASGDGVQKPEGKALLLQGVWFASPRLSGEGVMGPQSWHPQFWNVVFVDVQWWGGQLEGGIRDQRPSGS